MDAMSQMAGVLGSIQKTPEERRRAKNRRYYERNRERFGSIHHAICRLRKLAQLFEVPYANP